MRTLVLAATLASGVSWLVPQSVWAQVTPAPALAQAGALPIGQMKRKYPAGQALSPAASRLVVPFAANPKPV